MRFSIHSEIMPVIALASGTVAVTTNTASIDTQGCEALEVLFQFGATVQAGTTIKLQDSDDNSTWGDASTSDDGTRNYGELITSSLPAVNTVLGIGYVGNKRYVRGVITTSGNTVVGVIAVKARMHTVPGQETVKVPAASLAL